jgi:hypothetical protein
MRAFLVAVLMIGVQTAARSQSLEEDDPKLARYADPPKHLFDITRPVPRLKVSYRYLRVAPLERNPITFHSVALDGYVFSSYLRVGIGFEAGVGDQYDAWDAMIGASLGVQWPWRVTPFIDGRFDAGVLSGKILNTSRVSWLYAGGLEAGAEVYLWNRLYLSAALGWSHPVYTGIDIAAVMANPRAPVVEKRLETDTFTFRVGAGF